MFLKKVAKESWSKRYFSSHCTFRGYVHCLKLSPNLRKQTKEYRAAVIAEDDKTEWHCEMRQLKSILDMVTDPDLEPDDSFGIEEEDFD